MRYTKETVKFLKEIKSTDGVVIISHNDGDGICSAVLMTKLLEKMGNKKPYIISQPMPMDKTLIQRLKTTIPNKIIFLDLVVDQQEDILKKVRGLADVLIIDHHMINKNLNGGNVTNFNPRFTKSDAYKSASYCVYKIGSEIADMNDELWLVGVGMISDYNLDESKDVVEEVKKKYKIDDPFDSFLGKLSNAIAASRATKSLSCEQISELFLKVTDPEKIEDVHGGQKLIESLRIIDMEIEDTMRDAERNVKINGKLVSYNIKSKYNIDSVISTKISEKHRSKLVIVWSLRDDKRYKVSARNQEKNIGAGTVMKKACQGLKASGGGHEAAAGATVDVNDWNNFLENLRNIVNA